MSSKLSVYISNLGEYVAGVLRGTWIKLPVPQENLKSILVSIGVDDHIGEYFIADAESMFANLHISEFSRIEELNELAARLEELPDCEIDKLGAILECESSMTVAEILAIIDDLDCFDLIPDVEDDAALGEYYAELGCIFHNIPDSIQRYFDYAAYGRDIRMELNCCFTSYGIMIDNR